MNKHQLLGLLLEYKAEVDSKTTEFSRDLGTERNSWFYIQYALEHIITCYPKGFENLNSLIKEAHNVAEYLYQPDCTCFAEEYRSGGYEVYYHLKSVLSSMVESDVANV